MAAGSAYFTVIAGVSLIEEKCTESRWYICKHETKSGNKETSAGEVFSFLGKKFYFSTNHCQLLNVDTSELNFWRFCKKKLFEIWNVERPWILNPISSFDTVAVSDTIIKYIKD